jgi:inhibitor of cysteine peptidase
MKKILKILSLVLLVAAVVFAAGCSQKATTPGNENITQGNTNVTPENETAAQGNETVNSGNETVNSGNETVNSGNGTLTPEIGTTDISYVLNETDSGKTISLKNGENFTLDLKENPTTGYSWQLNLSKGLSILSDEYTEHRLPGEKEVTPGRGGTHSWLIQATAPGSQQVNGIYKRSWENTTGTEENFTLTVEVV